MVAAAESLKVGDGLEPGVDMGPVISAKHRERVLGYVEKGVAGGGEARGRRPRHGRCRPDGYFVGPTVFDEVSLGMTYRPRGDLRTGRDDRAGQGASTRRS